MNVDEARKELVGALVTSKCWLHGYAEAFVDDFIEAEVRAHVERKVDDAMVADAIMDSQYAAGMLLGWNLCEAGNHAEFTKIREARMNGSLRAIKASAIKAALGVEGPLEGIRQYRGNPESPPCT